MSNNKRINTCIDNSHTSLFIKKYSNYIVISIEPYYQISLTKNQSINIVTNSAKDIVMYLYLPLLEVLGKSVFPFSICMSGTMASSTSSTSS